MLPPKVSDEFQHFLPKPIITETYEGFGFSLKSEKQPF